MSAWFVANSLYRSKFIVMCVRVVALVSTNSWRQIKSKNDIFWRMHSGGHPLRSLTTEMNTKIAWPLRAVPTLFRWMRSLLWFSVYLWRPLINEQLRIMKLQRTTQATAAAIWFNRNDNRQNNNGTIFLHPSPLPTSSTHQPCVFLFSKTAMCIDACHTEFV